MRLWLTIILVSLFSVSLVACGKKARPKPPEEVAPAEVQFLTASGRVDGIRLSWKAPEKEAGGDELIDLVGFKVYRSQFRPGVSPDFEEIAEIPVRKISYLSEEQPEYEFVDSGVLSGQRYTYYIVGFNEDGTDGLVREIMQITFVGESSIIQRITQDD